MNVSVKRFLIVFFLCFMILSSSVAESDFTFRDDRFQSREVTTEMLDRIIQEYDLFDGWYWTTPPGVTQTFHGCEDHPGWTSTAEKLNKKEYDEGWYGCRWPIDHVRKAAPDRGGYAECFAFAQFVGYLLSGEINPQHHWTFYYSLKAAGALQVGDIVRVEYLRKGKQYHHSAVVYTADGDNVTFLQVSGGSYNKISVGSGFSDGNNTDVRSAEAIGMIPGLKISRWIPPEEEYADSDKR